MIWTILFLFLTVVTGVVGFLGLGYGPIEAAKIIFYFLGFILLVSFLMERRKGRKRYYE